MGRTPPTIVSSRDPLALALGARARPARDRLRVPDRVVDDHDQYTGQAEHDDHVHGDAEQVQHHDRRGDGQRNDHPGDHRRTPGVESQTNEQDDQSQPDEDRERHVAHRGFDERRGAVDGGVDSQVAEPRGEFLQRCFDAPGDFESVCLRELLDNQQQPAGLVDDAVTDQQLMVFDDSSDVAQAQPG